MPDHERLILAEKRHRYCVAVFVINEGERVRKQLAAMASFADRIDIVVADGGSTDGSLAPDTLAGLHLRALLIKRGPGSLSAQMRMAIAFALDEGYDGIVVIDGNGKDDLDAMPRIIELLDAGYDHIQGSRYVPGGRGINTPLSRTLAVKLIACAVDESRGGHSLHGHDQRVSRVQPASARRSARRAAARRLHGIRAPLLSGDSRRAARLQGDRDAGDAPLSGERKDADEDQPGEGQSAVLRTFAAAVLGRFDP